MEQRLLEEPPSPRLVDRVRVFNRQALAEVFDGSFDELYLYIHALVADHDTAERVAEDTFGRVLDRLPDYTGEPAGLKAWVLHHGADAVRRVPRGALAGKGLREAVARVARLPGIGRPVIDNQDAQRTRHGKSRMKPGRKSKGRRRRCRRRTCGLM